jgi:lipid-A-disaccharide synthase
MSSILIVAGENSGEKYGAGLVREFRRLRPQSRFFGIGGREMERAGVERLFSLEDLALVGLFEVLAHLPRLRRIFRSLLKEARARRPLAAVLIDSPDFNLRLAKRLKAAGIPVLYFVSPTVWAWRRGRLKKIKETVAQMLLIFPFEKPLYDKAGIPAAYIGHPLQEYLRVRLSRPAFLRKHGFDPRIELVTILPGSRRSEVKRHMPVLVQAARLLQETLPVNIAFILAENLDRDILASHLPSGPEGIKVLDCDRHEAMAASSLVLSACGTANLEAAMLGRPLVAFYKVSPLTYWAGRRLVRIKRYSIVNILAEKDVVAELIQRRFTPHNVLQEARRLLEDKRAARAQEAEFKRIRMMMGRKKPSAQAARELDRIIRGRSAKSRS